MRMSLLYLPPFVALVHRALQPLRSFASRTQPWALLLAISFAFNALAPTLAHALGGDVARGANARMMEICTAQGMKRVVIDADGVPITVPSDQASHPHCLFCPGAGDSFAPLIIVPISPLPATNLAAQRIRVAATTHPVGAPPTSAQARAPPLF